MQITNPSSLKALHGEVVIDDLSDLSDLSEVWLTCKVNHKYDAVHSTW